MVAISIGRWKVETLVIAVIVMTATGLFCLVGSGLSHIHLLESRLNKMHDKHIAGSEHAQTVTRPKDVQTGARSQKEVQDDDDEDDDGDVDAVRRVKRDVTEHIADDSAIKKDQTKTRERREKRGVTDIPEERRQPSFGNGGAVYVRWGRTTCESGNTELVYHGIAAGSWFDHVGGAANTLCLPNDPIWGRYTDAVESLAFIYGAEYESDNNMFLHNNAEKLLQHNVPCAVCRSVSRGSVVMVPARNVCYRGWHLEYQGYLMAGHHAKKSASDYICVDEAPEADPSGFRDENGRWFMQVEAQCGSLPCPNYANGRELTCAICTK